jgi:putative toxin-antitoxin system antitoxin component (TIGR02293 family)
MAAQTTQQLAKLLGVKSAKPITPLDLSKMVQRGLSVETVENVCRLIAPGDVSLRYQIIPRATLARRAKTAEKRLSPEQSDKVARLARLWAFSADVWGSETQAQRFLGEPHPLLRGRVPRELAAESEIGARAVEDLLGRLKFGSAV